MNNTALIGSLLWMLAGIGGTYIVMERVPTPTPAPYDTSAIERLNARLDELVALQQKQLVVGDRQIMLGRIMVRATTGSDPLPILQQSGK